jgi:hypothetical protein
MTRLIHPKYLRVILPAILISATLLVVSCNNNKTKETTTSDTVSLKTDSTVLRDNTNMTIDTTHKDTTKGEQTPPPR